MQHLYIKCETQAGSSRVQELFQLHGAPTFESSGVLSAILPVEEVDPIFKEIFTRDFPGKVWVSVEDCHSKKPEDPKSPQRHVFVL